MPKRKAEKPAKEGQAPEAPEPGPEDLPERAGMDRAELAKMLNYLRYKVSAASKAEESEKSAAQNALHLYKKLPAAKKADFLAKFGKSKKDLSWTKQFVQHEATEEREDNILKKGMFNRNEILLMNGLNPLGP